MVEQFMALPLVTGSTPVVTATANPLIALHSAPSCPVGTSIRVRFYRSSGGYSQSTPRKSCVQGQTMNFYVAGMHANTQYTLISDLFSVSGSSSSAPLTFTTGTPTVSVNSYVVVGPSAPAYPSGPGLLLQSPLGHPGASPVATDLYGNLLWYYSTPVASLTRPSPGGNMFVLLDTASDPSHQLIRQIDVAGNTLLETNVARMNEWLASYGKTITGFSHEARLLPNGNILTIGYTERILTNVQGSGAVDVLGDIILVLNPSLQPIWVWDTFDHLDVTRKAVLGETCQNTPPTPGCPVITLASVANDWVHGNSLLVASDGSIIYSSRHQDFVYRIDYGNGSGTGDVLWKLGKGGDFTYNSTDPYPWFSHQHDTNFDLNGIQLMTVMDDGDTRVELGGFGTTSRGQALNIDQTAMTVTFNVNADLQQYCAAAGSAELLPNGHYHFESAILAQGQSPAVEVDGSGNVVYVLQSRYTKYRSFRLPDLYSATY